MSPVVGISGSGRSAEEAFRAITGAERPPRAAVGDAVLDGHLVEIKTAGSTTLNQVRAVKYLPVVVHYRPDDEWFVIPAHRVVQAVSAKRRGQHTENPFESATLNLSHFEDCRVPSSDLRVRTLEAVQESARYAPLQEAMEQIKTESVELAQRSRQRVLALLRDLGLA